MIRFILLLAIGAVFAFAAAVWLNTPAGPGSLPSRMETTAREALGLPQAADEGAPAPMMAEGRRATPSVNISAQDLAIITAAIRAELRQEAEAQARQQLWQDVGLGVGFMLFGAMFGQFGRLTRLA